MPPSASDPLLILKDLGGVNELVDGARGGVATVPAIARGDVGLLWTADLTNALAVRAQKLTVKGIPVSAAAGGGSSSANLDFETPFVVQRILCGVGTFSAGGYNAVEHIRAVWKPAGALNDAVPLFYWDAASASPSANWFLIPTIQRGFPNDTKYVGTPPLLPLILHVGSRVSVYLETTGASVNAVDLVFNLWGYQILPGLPYPKP